MTAPTTRETADYIGEANEKVTADHAELARLAEAKQSWSLGIYKNREQAADAAKFSSLDIPATVIGLLSEIAALRGDLTEARVAADLLVSSVRADLRQAERQRDEAVGLLRRWTQLDGQWSANIDTGAFLSRLANHGAD